MQAKLWIIGMSVFIFGSYQMESVEEVIVDNGYNGSDYDVDTWPVDFKCSDYKHCY